MECVEFERHVDGTAWLWTYSSRIFFASLAFFSQTRKTSRFVWMFSASYGSFRFSSHARTQLVNTRNNSFLLYTLIFHRFIAKYKESLAMGFTEISRTLTRSCLHFLCQYKTEKTFAFIVTVLFSMKFSI